MDSQVSSRKPFGLATNVTPEKHGELILRYLGGEGRTKRKPLVYVRRDHMAYLILLLYVLVMFIASRINGIEMVIASVLRW